MAAVLPENTDVLWLAFLALSIISLTSAVSLLRRASESRQADQDHIAALEQRVETLERQLDDSSTAAR